MRCPRCDEENPDRFRLCGFCGAALVREAPSEVRKVVTLVFADVSGSTALGERLDPESVRAVMSGFFEVARGVLERHGGTVEKFIGDAVMAAFGIPQVREDDALRAVRAAAELRDGFRLYGQEIESRYGTGVAVRIGVNTGEVVAGDASAGQAFASGDAVNVAARLEQAAPAGDVLLGEDTLRLVRDAVTVEQVEPLQLKGKSLPVPAWRLLRVASAGTGVARHFDAPLIGRTLEFAQLCESWQQAVDARDTRLVTIVAPAGAGKTRLLSELTSRVRTDAQVLIGSCLPYGEGITFWPIVEIVWQAAGVGDDDSPDLAARKLAELVAGEQGAAEVLERLGPALGLAGPQAPLEETFWAIRKLFEALARRRPLLVVLDDVHWAEETLLDLIEYLSGWTRGVPLLLICAARPELLERRPSVTSPRVNASTLLLEPLGPGGTDEFILWQLGSAPLPEDLRRSVLAAAEGNPLFVQELVRMLIDDGLIVREGETWRATAEVRDLTMPPTIQALLAARLDQLEAGERDIAQRASVVGQVFWSGAVRDLCLETARQSLGSQLHTLVRKELIVPETSTFAAEDAFRFGHILVRDAAYAGLAKRTRAELHERFAIWLEASRGVRASEYEEIVGYHLEQAATYRRELGDIADADRVAVEASSRLAAGGRRSLTSGDLPAAANLLGRAAAVLPDQDQRRWAIRLESLPALFETGRIDEASTVLDEILARTVDDALVLAARAWRGFIDLQRGRDSNLGPVARVQAWLSACERSGDHAGQATALGFLAVIRFSVGETANAEAIWERAAEQASLAGDLRAESDSLVWILTAVMFGPTPVGAAIERCDEIATRSRARNVRVMASIEHGMLEAMGGRIAHGRELVARGRKELQELGLEYLAIATGQEAAMVERLAEDHVAAETILRLALERFEQIGERSLYSTDAGMLAHTMYAQDRLDEAESFANLCRTTASGDDVMSNYLWRGALAKVAARRGDDAEALRLAGEAVDVVAQTDYVADHGDRLVDLAEVHALAGRATESADALDRADALYERKQCVVALEATRRRRRALMEESTAPSRTSVGPTEVRARSTSHDPESSEQPDD